MTFYKCTIINSTISTWVPVNTTTVSYGSTIIEVTILNQTICRFFKPFYSTTKVSSFSISNIGSNKFTIFTICSHIYICTIISTVMVNITITYSISVTFVVNTPTIFFSIVVRDIGWCNTIIITNNINTTSISTYIIVSEVGIGYSSFTSSDFHCTTIFSSVIVYITTINSSFISCNQYGSISRWRFGLCNIGILYGCSVTWNINCRTIFFSSSIYNAWSCNSHIVTFNI